jgi:hypothetical protein
MIYLRQFSLIVPYLSALVPLAEVAHIPQIEAFAPGSTGNQRPEKIKQKPGFKN